VGSWNTEGGKNQNLHLPNLLFSKRLQKGSWRVSSKPDETFPIIISAPLPKLFRERDCRNAAELYVCHMTHVGTCTHAGSEPRPQPSALSFFALLELLALSVELAEGERAREETGEGESERGNILGALGWIIRKSL